MKNKIITLFLSCLLLLTGCIKDIPPAPPKGETDTTHIEEDITVQNHHQNAVYVYQTEVNENALKTGLDKAYLVLANKNAVLGEDYTPANLLQLDNEIVPSWHHKTGLKLEAFVASALYEMMEEMKHAGIENTLVTSAYRSYARQQELYSDYIQKEMLDITDAARACLGDYYIHVNYTQKGLTALNREDAVRVVQSYSATPGTSEHQTGLCVDFITKEMGYNLDVSFETYPAFDWLSKNAYKFGFILRYPKEKETITGYTYEPWHYRFVGREAATDMYFSNLTLEEYLTATES